MKNIVEKLLLFYKDLSIKNKLLLLFYIQIVIPLLFIGYTSYQKSAQIIEYKSINYSQDILKMIELRFSDLASSMKVLTLELLYDNRVYDALSPDGSEQDNLSAFNKASELKSILRQSTLSRNEIQSICVVTNAKQYYSFDLDNGKATIEAILPYEDALKHSREGRGKLVWYLDKADGKVNNVYVTRVIYDRDSYEEIGFIAILIKREYLESVYNDLSKESIKNISILSEDNEEIISKESGGADILNSFYQKQLQNDRGYYIDKKADMLVSYVVLDDPDWKIVYHIPLKELYWEINTLRKWVILIVIYGLVLLSILSVLTSIDIIRPINKLVEAMKKVEKGIKHEEIAPDRNDELGYLNKSFNRMSGKIDYLVNKIYKEELALKEAEIKALQAQINPHFLFNTLENINWMAQLNGVPEISETVSALAKLMDANIGRGDRLVTLREEFDYIDNYMTILKNRYEDRLMVEKNVDDIVLDAKIPRLLIQPLVENAVKHGIEKSRRSGIISLSAYKKDGDILIEVLDNGAGMQRDELEELNKRLGSGSLSSEYGNSGKSVGLENVNRRIKLFFGDEYGIKIESSSGEYTKVMVRIPENMPDEGVSEDVQSSVS